MKTQADQRPEAGEPRTRTRLVVAAVLVVVVAAAAIWWIGSAGARRVDAACGLYDGQQAPLRTLVDDVNGAGAAATTAGDPTILAYFENADATLNVMRRWQSTLPRVRDELGGAEASGADEELGTTLVALTDSVAELQRVVEANTATPAVTAAAGVTERLDAADALCG